MQGKVNTYAKKKRKYCKKDVLSVKACKNWSGQIARTAILKCSEKIPFQENMRGGDHSFPAVQLAAWNVTKEQRNHNYFLAIYLKLLITSILPLGQMRSAAREVTTSTARLYLTNMNCNVLLLITIICDAYHCQHALTNQYISIWYLWFRISFAFPVGSSFQPQNTLNLNHGLSYHGNLHLLVLIPLSESKDQEKVSLHYIQPPLQNVTAIRADTCPLKHH